jgi:hypothetical protein
VLVVVAQRREQVGQVMVEEAVVGVAAVAADGDEPRLAQQPQLVRRGAVRHPDLRGEVLDRALTVQQRPQQPQPAGRAERAHRLGELLGLLLRERPAGVLVLGGMRHSPKRTSGAADGKCPPRESSWT